MLKNENIICISSIDWDFVWQGHQEIMAMFTWQATFLSTKDRRSYLNKLSTKLGKVKFYIYNKAVVRNLYKL